MKITIVGGGNIGTQFAVHAAEKKNDVYIYTSKPHLFQKNLTIVDENKNMIHQGEIKLATDNEEEAFKEADLIIVTVPSFAMNDSAQKILPYVNTNMKICLIPGTGGGECSFKEHIEKGAILFGLQRVPSVARLVEYGKCVCATGYRVELFVASLPSRYSEECSKLIGQLLDMKCSALPNYLNLTLTPSNPILHTTRLKTIFKNYKDGVFYDDIPLFYEGWDNETSELLFKCDDEVQELCRKLNTFDLSYVKSLKIHYESDTPEKLTQKIKSIKGFKGLTTPSIENNGKLIPDLNSRYFTADFNYGLSILVQIAKILNVDVPNMEETIEWYRKISIFKEEFDYKRFGINDLNSFVEFYSK